MKKLLSIAFAVTVMASAAMSQEKRIYLDMTQFETFSLNDPQVKELMSASDFNRCKDARKAYLKSGATQKGGNPSVLSITGAMAFFTVGVDSIATYFDYVGSTSAFDQVGFQIGKASASMFDTTMVQYVQTMPADQLVFVRKNCESGVQYRFKFFVFDAANGTVTFYPTGNGSYYATTTWVAMSSLSHTSYLNCAAAVKSVDIGPASSNDPNTWIKVMVDTGANPFTGGAYPQTWTMPQFNIGAIGTVFSYSINVSSLIKWDPNNKGAVYTSKVIMWNSAGWKDSTISSCILPTSVDEITAAGKAFKLFPNPNPTSVESIVDGNLELLDLTGKVISSEKISAGQTMLAKKDVPSGLYFYQLSNMKGERIITVKTVLLK